MSINNNPVVSIGMPVYNGEQYIRRALDSLLAQTFSDFELIVSDNASTDKTWEISKDYASRNKRIILYRQKKNLGGVFNFKFVLSKAKGKYFMWAAADDYWLPEFISILVEELETYPEVGVAMCAVDRVYKNGRLFDTVKFIGKDNPNHKSYYKMMKGLTSSKKYNLYIYGLFRTYFLRRAAVCFPEVPGGDRLFICQMALGTKFRYIDNVLYIRRHYNEPIHVRRPDESFNIMKNEDKLVDIKILFTFGKMIIKSPIICWYRKAYLPIVLWRYGRLLLLSKFAPKIKKWITPNIQARLKMFKRLIFKN